MLYDRCDLFVCAQLRGAFVNWILDPRMAQQLPLLRNKLAQTVTSVIRVSTSGSPPKCEDRNVTVGVPKNVANILP